MTYLSKARVDSVASPKFPIHSLVSVDYSALEAATLAQEQKCRKYVCVDKFEDA